MEVIGYILAGLVGGIMGLLGSGGSLIVPVMVFLFGKDDITATGYALFLVGFTATSGVLSKLRKREIAGMTALTLVIPVSFGTWLGRGLIHALPEILFQIGNYPLSRRQVVLGIYALMLILSFLSMMGLLGKDLRARPELRQERPLAYFSLIGLLGLIIGVLSGLTGAGGGILIVPVIVVLMGIPMKIAVGTSLTIQVFKSYIGFSKDWVEMGSLIEWKFIFTLTAVMVVGILLGSKVSNYIDGSRLKKAYGWFVLLMGIFILVKELIFR
jgi:uncharacterized membrane protein YfcA